MCPATLSLAHSPLPLSSLSPPLSSPAPACTACTSHSCTSFFVTQLQTYKATDIKVFKQALDGPIRALLEKATADSKDYQYPQLVTAADFAMGKRNCDMYVRSVLDFNNQPKWVTLPPALPADGQGGGAGGAGDGSRDSGHVQKLSEDHSDLKKILLAPRVRPDLISLSYLSFGRPRFPVGNVGLVHTSLYLSEKLRTMGLGKLAEFGSKKFIQVVDLTNVTGARAISYSHALAEVGLSLEQFQNATANVMDFTSSVLVCPGRSGATEKFSDVSFQKKVRPLIPPIVALVHATRGSTHLASAAPRTPSTRAARLSCGRCGRTRISLEPPPPRPARARRARRRARMATRARSRLPLLSCRASWQRRSLARRRRPPHRRWRRR